MLRIYDTTVSSASVSAALSFLHSLITATLRFDLGSSGECPTQQTVVVRADSALAKPLRLCSRDDGGDFVALRVTTATPWTC